MFLPEKLFSDHQCLLVKRFRLPVLRKIGFNSSQLAVTSRYIRMFLTEKLFSDHQCLLVKRFCFFLLRKLTVNFCQVVVYFSCFISMLALADIFFLLRPLPSQNIISLDCAFEGESRKFLSRCSLLLE